MKEYWEKLASRIDALSLRERAMAFGIAALVLVSLVNSFLVDPQFSQQKKLAQKVNEDQQQIAAMQAEIRQRVMSHDVDPDASTRLRLQQLLQQSAKMKDELAGMQNGLVSPDKMPMLLEDLLRRDGRLRLKSLKTLSVSLLNEPLEAVPAQGSAPASRPAQKEKTDKADQAEPKGAVYKHGVEIVVVGSYADITHYLEQLERMPWQLFWAKARLNVDAYPDSSLTLTLFTLSLDKKWLNI
ncbi:type II secretion system protein GspM [Noviherbaspirillum sp. Root189]|uniref:type II secretion system protein GspM n=1 Tax=Noviherbaspirillum sp. Root189 TaxID=1736487 RepID=UPI000709D41F|nr:type II secretion system protein GspM [Noviherbaspirillum sp. Root189]KRB84599.1 MSHA biogenesis protein MshJ [Noviherbaspirillum sp. Root189]